MRVFILSKKTINVISNVFHLNTFFYVDDTKQHADDSILIAVVSSPGIRVRVADWQGDLGTVSE